MADEYLGRLREAVERARGAQEAINAAGLGPRRVELDQSDLQDLERALDALETLHDDQADEIGTDHVRDCLCAEASSWRQARKVTVAIRRQLGLKVRLLDQV